jgi:hypothetical protein
LKNSIKHIFSAVKKLMHYEACRAQLLEPKSVTAHKYIPGTAFFKKEVPGTGFL